MSGGSDEEATSSKTFENPVFDEFEDDNAEDVDMNIADELLLMMSTFCISHRLMQYILDLLIKFRVAGVPKTVYQLQNSCKLPASEIVELKDGYFSYFSICDNLKTLIDSGYLLVNSSLDLILNVDGLPLFRSSGLSTWPILMSIPELRLQCPLPVGFFCGFKKPDVATLLSKLCNELIELKASNFRHKTIEIAINNIIFVADASARILLQCIKSHNAKLGCAYCRVVGRRLEDRTVFLGYNHEPRSDSMYSLFKENNQTSLSPLCSVPGVQLSSSFPIDYQHLICLGLMRRLCNFYFSSIKGFKVPCKFSPSQIKEASAIVTSVRRYIPTEFSRKMRDFSELPFFKATEFRFLLLYIGPYVFRKLLRQDFYRHFLLLHFSIYSLSVHKAKSYVECSKACIHKFLDETVSLFSEKCLTYNFHLLSHLPDFVTLYGEIDRFSTFRFENYLSQLKKRIKPSSNVHKQINNSMLRLRKLNIYERESSLTYSDTEPNNCCLTPKGVIFVSHVNDGLVSGRLLKFCKDLYVYPYPSSTHNIGFYVITDVYITDVLPVTKCFCFPHKSRFVVVPYCNQFYHS